MPVMSCTVGEKNGYKYGESGHCYTYNKDDEPGRKEAKRKAILQGTAIAHNSGEKLELSKSDLEDINDEEIVMKLEPETMVKDDSNNLLFGWAYVAIDKDGNQVVDHSGEFVKEENFEDLELATYAYNLAFREADRQHDCVAKGYLVESIVFTKDKMSKIGIPEGTVHQGVWMGFYFPSDDDYNEIKKMEHPMFSLYGKATKELLKEYGLGRMGGPLAAGPDGMCICPSCGAKVAHETGKPCSDINCPKCGTKMTREEE